jgi:hypothetical protein
MEQERGSTVLWEKVFEEDMPEEDDMSRALGDARLGYAIKRWWKYGTPQIDRVAITLAVQPDAVGHVIQDVLGAHGRGVRVVINDGFPLGTPPYWDEFQLNFTLERELR